MENKIVVVFVAVYYKFLHLLFYLAFSYPGSGYTLRSLCWISFELGFEFPPLGDLSLLSASAGPADLSGAVSVEVRLTIRVVVKFLVSLRKS